jgi:AraC-like DNA-binding protein
MEVLGHAGAVRSGQRAYLTMRDSFLTICAMLDLTRASALDGYSELVRQLGGDPEPILAASNLRSDLLGSTEAFIPFRSMARVIERTAVELKCPDFSMRLAAVQSIHILGPIALIARHSSTAREAFQGIAEHMSNFSPALRVGLDGYTETHTRYTFEVLVSGISSHTQIYQLGLGVSLGVFRLLMGAEFRPLLVSIPHAQPDLADSYARFFGCRVQFDSDYAGMLLPSADLDRPRASHDPDVREYVARFLDAERPADDDLVGQVRHLIARTLSTGHADSATIASHLGLHTRTLQRWLAKRGETFESLLDEVRCERAAAYLSRSALSFGQIAALLGYSEQSCLSRSSIRWFGASPRAVRNAGDTPSITATEPRRRHPSAT